MARLLEWQERRIQGSHSVLGFERQNNGFSRNLTVEGKPAYHTGIMCGTCEFLFERLGVATDGRGISVPELVEHLTVGFRAIEATILDRLCQIVPDGEYVCALLEIHPHLVVPGSAGDYFSHEQIEVWGVDPFWGLPHHPKTKYYRGNSLSVHEHAELFEFVVPMFPDNWLDEDRVSEFRTLLRAGAAPTALSLSVLDIKQHYDSVDEHWCLSHYLMDGHHKVFAASQEGKPVTLLAFIHSGQSGATKEDVVKLLSRMP